MSDKDSAKGAVRRSDSDGDVEIIEHSFGGAVPLDRADKYMWEPGDLRVVGKVLKKDLDMSRVDKFVSDPDDLDME